MEIDLSEKELELLVGLVHHHGMEKHRKAEPEMIETPFEMMLLEKLNTARESVLK